MEQAGKERSLMAARRKRSRLARLGSILLSAIYLTVVGLVVGGTYAYYTSKVESSGTVQAADAQDIFEAWGEFDEEEWLAGGGSGLYVKNVSPNTLWVYFSVSDAAGGSSLRDLIKHINPARLEPGETLEIPLEVDQHTDLQINAWRIKDTVFTGNIIARVYNNYASHTFEGIRISAAKLWERVRGNGANRSQLQALDVPEVADDTELATIASVDDVIRLLNENRARGEEIEHLVAENDRLSTLVASLEQKVNSLLETIASLTSENSFLANLVESLQGKLDSLLTSPPTEPPADQPGRGDGEQLPIGPEPPLSPSGSPPPSVSDGVYGQN